MWKAIGLYKVKVARLCLTLCDSRDLSPPGSSVHEILQARILEWVAISFSRGSSWPRDWTWGLLHCRQIFFFLPSEPPGKLRLIQTHLEKVTFGSEIKSWILLNVMDILYAALSKQDIARPSHLLLYLAPRPKKLLWFYCNHPSKAGDRQDCT